MARYQAVKEKHKHPDAGAYTAWGIRGRQTGDGKVTADAYIPDVFLCEKDAENFACMCTKLDLAIYHLHDAVEAYLAK